MMKRYEESIMAGDATALVVGAKVDTSIQPY